MAKKFEKAKEPVLYLYFCKKCGTPRRMSKFFLENSVKKHGKTHYICDCLYLNTLPEHFLKLIDELINTI
jgi:hypothetical protein